MALLLNIETSAQVCSVCLSKDGEVLEIRENRDGKSHASSLTPYIEDIFKISSYKMNDIDAVVISKGPGSYTGLRIGVSTAKGICFALNKPLIAINTLEALSSGVIQNQEVTQEAFFAPLIDARRMEVYSAIFDFNLKEVREIKAEIIDDNSFIEHLEKSKIYFFGDGAEKCKETINHNNFY
jgi:tRNA threonylcarbamoyladenosine biosynthesis protein TsaB